MGLSCKFSLKPIHWIFLTPVFGPANPLSHRLSPETTSPYSAASAGCFSPLFSCLTWISWLIGTWYNMNMLNKNIFIYLYITYIYIVCIYIYIYVILHCWGVVFGLEISTNLSTAQKTRPFSLWISGAQLVVWTIYFYGPSIPWLC